MVGLMSCSGVEIKIAISFIFIVVVGFLISISLRIHWSVNCLLWSTLMMMRVALAKIFINFFCQWLRGENKKVHIWELVKLKYVVYILLNLWVLMMCNWVHCVSWFGVLFWLDWICVVLLYAWVTPYQKWGHPTYIVHDPSYMFVSQRPWHHVSGDYNKV